MCLEIEKFYTEPKLLGKVLNRLQSVFEHSSKSHLLHDVLYPFAQNVASLLRQFVKLKKKKKKKIFTFSVYSFRIYNLLEVAQELLLKIRWMMILT